MSILKVNTIQHANGTEAMTIDSSGNLSFPGNTTIAGNLIKADQPAFLAYNASSGNPILWASTVYNIGNHYNPTNGRFTAPVAGRYFMYCNIHGANPDGGTADFRMLLNGGDTAGGGACRSVSYYAQATGVVILNLLAGDYVTTRAYSTFTNVLALSSFGGYLIG